MQRRPWFEIHDHRLFPGRLRNLVTDALEALWAFGNSYGCVLPRLAAAMQAAGACQVVDLCSGAGGPWPTLLPRLTCLGAPISIRLTDLHPNLEASPVLAARSAGCIVYEPQPVDATRVPRHMPGFRTMFSSFHHFAPAQARALLGDAAGQQQGIAVFEAATLHARTLAVITLLPLLVWGLTPGIRPFRWDRLVFTYIVPVIPLVILVDGWLSCLRSYSLDDLRELSSGLGQADYQWQVGEEKSGLLAIRYLLGCPGQKARTDAAGTSEAASAAHTPQPR